MNEASSRSHVVATIAITQHTTTGYEQQQQQQQQAAATAG
jgi:hypothetical protein